MPTRVSASNLPSLSRPSLTPARPREVVFTPGFVPSPVSGRSLPSPEAMTEIMTAVKQKAPAVGTLGARAIESMVADAAKYRQEDGLPPVSKLALQEPHVDLARMLHEAVTTGQASGDLRQYLTSTLASPNSSTKTRATLSKLQEALMPQLTAGAIVMPKSGPVSATVKVKVGGQLVAGQFTGKMSNNQLTDATVRVGTKTYALSNDALREVVRRSGKDIGEEGGALTQLKLRGGKAPDVLVREGNSFRPMTADDLSGQWQYTYQGKVWLEDVGALGD